MQNWLSLSGKSEIWGCRFPYGINSIFDLFHSFPFLCICCGGRLQIFLGAYKFWAIYRKSEKFGLGGPFQLVEEHFHLFGCACQKVLQIFRSTTPQDIWRQCYFNTKNSARKSFYCPKFFFFWHLLLLHFFGLFPKFSRLSLFFFHEHFWFFSQGENY